MVNAISEQGIALIRTLEGFHAHPFALEDGRWIAGHNHVLSDRPDGPVTEAQADAWLREDLRRVEALLNERLLAPVTQSQFDALCSFAFSIGLGAFAKSDVLRRFNAGEPIAAACAMDAWRRSAVAGETAVLDALVRRRTAEKAMFLAIDTVLPAASAWIRPELDHAASMLGQPTHVVSLPLADPTARRLADILAAEPATAHTLRPPVVEAPDEPVLELTEPAPNPAHTSNDVVALALFGMMGLGLVAVALLARSQNDPLLFLIFAAPGAVMLLSAAWQLLRERVMGLLPRLALRG